MNSDDLPSYPTPQQATYTMPHQSASAPRRNAKPHQYSSPGGPSQAPISHHTSPNGYQNQHQLPPAQDYSYQQARPYQPMPAQHQYHAPPPPNAYHNNSYSSPQQPHPSHAQPIQHRTQSISAQQYYSSAQPQTSSQPQNIPAPRAPSSSSQYGSAPQSSNFHQHQYQQPPSHNSGGTRSTSYTGPQQFSQPQSVSVPVPVPPSPVTSSSGRSHAPSKKPPPSSHSRESLDEAPKTSSKQRLEAELRATFDRVDTNHSGRISGRELASALINFDNTGFQHSTVRLMIKLFSSPSSGSSSSLNFEQFVSLWKYLTAYKKLFVAADVNKSGDISFGEFQRIIEQIGYKLNVDLVLHLFQKFANKEAHDDGSVAVGKLKFDAFIELLVYLRKLTDIFKQYDKQLTGVATIEYSDFLLEISNLT